MTMKKNPRVAIIHYWLVNMRGGERVLERLINLYPDADIFTHVYVPEAMSQTIRSRPVKETFIAKLPGARKHYQKYLPLMPHALEHLDLRGYDLVISSESGPAKGVVTMPDARHVCYVHSPMRYVWDHYHDYRDTAGRLARMMMPVVSPWLRQWDESSAQRVDTLVANSSFIKRRIKRSWGLESSVVHPPVDSSLFHRSSDVQPFYLWVGQMTSYKRADLAVDAFNKLGLPLVMVGTGEQGEKLRRKAGPNITFHDHMDFDGLRRLYADARALVFTAEEDFGIVPVEAMASGRPVIAFGKAGILDTVVPGQTGLFFDEQTPEALIDAVERFDRWLPDFDPQASIDRALMFSPEIFDEGIRAAVDERSFDALQVFESLHGRASMRGPSPMRALG